MATLNLRVLERIDDRGVIKLTCVDEGDATLYTSTADGSAPPIDGGITGIGDTILEVLDIPLQAEADDRPGIYIAATSMMATWPGCVVARSVDDGTTFVNVGSLRSRAVIGYTETQFIDWGGGNTLDPGAIEIYVLSGTLASVTWDELLQGANRAVVGDEVIAFKSATLIDTKTYRLSGFLRGLNGTEWAMRTHARRDRFVLLDDAVERFDSPLSIVGQTVTYRGTSFGHAAADGYETSLTELQLGITPLPPVYLSIGDAGVDGYLASWVRRTRYPDSWRDGGDVPLDESSERYRVRVWFDNDAALIDTETNDTEITFGAGLDLTYYIVEVQQVSDLVGVGRKAETTIG